MTTKTHDRPPLAWRLFMKAQNPFMMWLLKSPLHGVVSRQYMLITVTGRKSGKHYTTPVQYAQHGQMLYIITSAGYMWWRNLRGGATVQVRLRGAERPAHATTSEDPADIHTLLSQLYPTMTEQQRTGFVPGKVAVTLVLADEPGAASG